jgi:hypothetical protein
MRSINSRGKRRLIIGDGFEIITKKRKENYLRKFSSEIMKGKVNLEDIVIDGRIVGFLTTR